MSKMIVFFICRSKLIFSHESVSVEKMLNSNSWNFNNSDSISGIANVLMLFVCRFISFILNLSLNKKKCYYFKKCVAMKQYVCGSYEAIWILKNPTGNTTTYWHMAVWSWSMWQCAFKPIFFSFLWINHEFNCHSQDDGLTTFAGTNFQKRFSIENFTFLSTEFLF